MTLLKVLFIGAIILGTQQVSAFASEPPKSLSAEQQTSLLQRFAPIWVGHGKNADENDKLWPICSPSYLFAHAEFVRHPRPGKDEVCEDVPRNIVGRPDRIVKWLEGGAHSEQTSDVVLRFDKRVILGEVGSGVADKDRRVEATKLAIQQGKGAFGAVHQLKDGTLSLKYFLLFTFNEATFEDFNYSENEGDGNHFADVVAIDLIVRASDLNHAGIVGCYMHNHGRVFDVAHCLEIRRNMQDGTEHPVVYLEGGSNEAHPNASRQRGFAGHPVNLLANKWFGPGHDYHSEWKIVGGHAGDGFVYDTQGKVRDLQNPKPDDIDSRLLMLFRGRLGGSYYQPHIVIFDVGPIVDSPPSPRWQPKMWEEAFDPPKFEQMPNQ